MLRSVYPFLLLSVLLAISVTAADSTSVVRNTSYVAPTGERVLQHEVVIPARLDSVWWAFTTTEGVLTWMVPVASIDLRTGGLWETNYSPSAKIGDSANIRNTVLCYIPNRMLSFKVNLTDPFPVQVREAGTLFYVIEMEEVGENRVKVVGSMLGWGEGPQWNDVYNKFDWGNSYTFEKLHERFTKGPRTWPVRPPQ